jgi:CDP-paratose 2-epimerase
MKILVTGGAGFVGSGLALALTEDPGVSVVALDNLKRRGSELALPRLAAGGVAFFHGDIRLPEDLDAVGPVDLIIDCAAEPSVQAGLDGQTRYLVGTNLAGTFNCLELARRTGAGFILLSTSRVYSIPALRGLPLAIGESRLDLRVDATGQGWSHAGITEAFPTSGPRSLYGATKLAAEMLVEEYGALYGMPYVINRCGVIAGPWQMGKVDQGFFVLWVLRHLFRGRLDYHGFGGTGLQVRDVLHLADLADLVKRQVAALDTLSGGIFNVGGGRANAVSLAELTALCESVIGAGIEIGHKPDTNVVDVPFYVTDNSRVTSVTGWRPSRGIDTILADVLDWLAANRDAVARVLDGRGSEAG